MKNKFTDFLNERPLNQYAFGIFIMLVVLIVLRIAFGIFMHTYYDMSARINYYDYIKISYIGKDGDELLFSKESVIHESHATTYTDSLRCINPNETTFSLYSSQTTEETPPVTTKYAITTWKYTHAYPKDSTCALERVITMHVYKNGRYYEKKMAKITDPFSTK